MVSLGLVGGAIALGYVLYRLVTPSPSAVCAHLDARDASIVADDPVIVTPRMLGLDLKSE